MSAIERLRAFAEGGAIGAYDADELLADVRHLLVDRENLADLLMLLCSAAEEMRVVYNTALESADADTKHLLTQMRGPVGALAVRRELALKALKDVD